MARPKSLGSFKSVDPLAGLGCVAHGPRVLGIQLHRTGWNWGCDEMNGFMTLCLRCGLVHRLRTCLLNERLEEGVRLASWMATCNSEQMLSFSYGKSNKRWRYICPDEV